MFWYYLQILSGTFLILRRSERDIIVSVHLSSCKVPEILINFQRNLKFLDRISKNTPISNLMKSPSSGSRVVSCERTDRQIDRHTVGQTDMTKLRATVLNSGNARNNVRNWNNSKLLLKPLRRMIQRLVSTCKPVRPTKPFFQTSSLSGIQTCVRFSLCKYIVLF